MNFELRHLGEFLIILISLCYLFSKVTFTLKLSFYRISNIAWDRCNCVMKGKLENNFLINESTHSFCFMYQGIFRIPRTPICHLDTCFNRRVPIIGRKGILNTYRTGSRMFKIKRKIKYFGRYKNKYHIDIFNIVTPWFTMFLKQ